MKTEYPFEIPAKAGSVPPAHRDGKVYADVKFRGRWDGILVIDSHRQCIGVYVGREIVQCSLPFTPDQIQQLRAASLWNRLLANLPGWLGPYDLAVLTIWIACPILLLLGFTFSTWAFLLVPPLVFAGFSVMYQVSGFPFSRFPTSVVGLIQTIVAVIGFVLSWLD